MEEIVLATNEQIESVLRKFEKATPKDFFKCVDGAQLGMTAVLRLLNESDAPQTAGAISDALEVSTARVAVLLRKMVSKGLVTKDSSVMDARVTLVELTPQGKAIAQAHKQYAYEKVGRVIDEIGEEQLDAYIEISAKIQEIFKCDHSPL